MTNPSIERSLGRIEAKLDLALESQKLLQDRTTVLEHANTRFAAFATFAGAAGSALWAVATSLLGKET